MEPFGPGGETHTDNWETEPLQIKIHQYKQVGLAMLSPLPEVGTTALPRRQMAPSGLGDLTKIISWETVLQLTGQSLSR